MKRPPRHLVIPDTQVQPGVDLAHFDWIGRYIADKRPNVIVHLGDHYDLPSLCVYDRDLDEVMGRRYAADLAAGDEAFARLSAPWRSIRGYRPRLLYTLGNHEERFVRLMGEQPKLRGALRAPGAYAAAHGWTVAPYLRPVVIHGVAYAHQFVRSSNGRVTSSKWGAPNARTQVLREMRSCTAGHKPGLDFHIQPAGARSLYGLIAGSCYRHAEDWMSPQGDRYWRGIVVKHEVHAGEYDAMFVSLRYLRRKYA